MYHSVSGEGPLKFSHTTNYFKAKPKIKSQTFTQLEFQTRPWFQSGLTWMQATIQSMIWPCGRTYGDPIGVDEHPFATYVDVHQGGSWVLTTTAIFVHELAHKSRPQIVWPQTLTQLDSDLPKGYKR